MSTTYSADSLGLASGSDFTGYVKNLFVDTSEVHVPLIGAGLSYPLNLYGINTVGGKLIVRLSEGVPSGITGNLKAYVKNFTASTILGYVLLSSGGTNGEVSTDSISVNNGDQVALVIVSTAGSGFVPFISWEISEGDA